jgi:adenylyl-sulfate kinase
MTDRNLTAQTSKILVEEREQRLNQRGVTLWFTGLSASGKSTVAGALERRLFDDGHLVYWLDGDNVRMGLNGDLGFSPEDRTENIRRIAETAHLFNDAGLLVIAAFVSPYGADRENARKIIGEDRFCEVFISASLATCESRDPKGLYQKARDGIIPQFTGVSAPYEAPENATIVLDTENSDVSACVDQLMQYLDDTKAFEV